MRERWQPERFDMKKSWAEKFLFWELLSGITASLLIVAALEFADDGNWTSSFLSDSGPNFYAALAQINAALLGFAIAAAAIIVTAAPDDRLAELRNSEHFKSMWAIFRSAIRFLGAATLLSLLGLLVTDDGLAARTIFYATIAVSILAAFRITRCVWAMNWIIKIFMKGSAQRPAGG